MLAIALATHGSGALPLGNDTVFLNGTALVGYDSNLFLVPDGTSLPAALGGPQKDDFYFGLGAGIRLNLPVSRQRFRAKASVTRYDYQHFDSLDYTGYNGRVSWDWVGGNDWSGLLTAGLTRTRQSATDQQGAAFPRLVTFYDVSGTARYALTPRWTLSTAIGYNASKYDDNVFRGSDFEVARFDLGASYRSPQGNSTGARLRYEQGRWPNRTGSQATNFGTEYAQYTLSAVLDWRLSGSSRLHGDIGYTILSRNDAMVGDFNGPSGTLTYDYSLSSKTTLQASIYEIRGPTEANFATYIRTRGITLGSQYQVSGKTSLNASLGFSQVTYLGQVLTPAAPQQQYDYWNVGLGALYHATRVISLNAGLAYQWRTSSLPLGDYQVFTGSVSVTAEF